MAPSFTAAVEGETVSVPPLFGGAMTSSPKKWYLVPLAAVASILQVVPTAADAVNRPLALIDPQVAVHVTGTEGVNCCVLPWGVLTTAGVKEIGDVIVTFATAALPPAFGVAVTVQARLARADVKSPVLEIVPQLAVQVALALAVNCCVAPSLNVTVVGEIEKAPDDPMVSAAVAV